MFPVGNIYNNVSILMVRFKQNKGDLEVQMSSRSQELSMTPAKQRVIDHIKFLAIPLLERKNNHRKFRLQKKNKKTNAIRQRGEN